MSAKFYVVGSFFVRSKNLFMVVGDVVEGECKAGDEILLDLGNISVSTSVKSVEVVDVTYMNKKYLGLAFGFDEPDELEFWQAMSLSDETLTLRDGRTA